jgi:hydroxyacylglutathione hydrolase
MTTHEYRFGPAVLMQFRLGGDRNFSYLVADTESGDAAAVDPAFGTEPICSAANERGFTIRKILITHAHSDHTGEAVALPARTGAILYAAGGELVPAPNLNDGLLLPLGEKTIRSIHTPGHSPDHFCFLFENILFTGDLLFCGKVGGTGPHFPGSSAKQEWDSLQRILQLPDSVQIFPGHDYYGGEGSMQHSSIGHERRYNPFLLCDTFQDFYRLKQNWEAYKVSHGIR